MTWSTVRLSAVPVPVAEPVQALMEQASVGGTGPGAAEQTTSGASPGSDPGKAALPAFQHGPLAFHPQTLPAAYPFGYWTGQGAPLVYGGPFYGGILPGMFQSPPAEAPKLGTREQAVVPGDAPETSDRKPDPRSLSEGRSSARTRSSQSLDESPTAAQSTPTVPDHGTSQLPPAPTGFVRVQPSNGNSQDRQVLPGLWRPKAMAPASATDLQSLASGDSPQDDRESKKLRRKQSNRESARRSRLRKQAECQSLSGRVDSLQADNQRLREANKQLQARLEALQPEQGARGIAAASLLLKQGIRRLCTALGAA